MCYYYFPTSKIWLTAAWALLVAASKQEHHVQAYLHIRTTNNNNHGQTITNNPFLISSSIGRRQQRAFSSASLPAAPKRLEENVEGVVYVNDRCINCAACANFAPSVFRRADRDPAHIVHHQPATREEILDARAAMAACPVAAIRSETLARRRHRAADAERKESVQELWTSHDEELVRLMALNPKLNGLELPFPRPLLYHDAAAATTTTSTNDSSEHPSATSSSLPLQQPKDNHNITNVYNVGHHNDASFGATPYLVQATVNGTQKVWIMVDTPRFGPGAVRTVTQVTGPKGPDYLLLTHVDDTADHDKWAAEFAPNLRRIFHAGDTGRHNWRRDEALDTDVEILLPLPPPPDDDDPVSSESSSSPLRAYSLDGRPLANDWYHDFVRDPDNDVVVLHTPGHSPGSITLWKKATHRDGVGIIFTGDHYAYSSRTGRMSGFPRYGHDLRLQAASMEKLLQLEWDVVAPGHGQPRDYSSLEPNKKDELKRQEMMQAIADLFRS